MKSKILLLSIASTLAFSPAFAASNSTNQNSATTANTTSNQAATNNQADGEVLGFLVVLDQNEMTAAKDALSKKVSPKVKSYAKMLWNDHNKNLKETMRISKKMNQSPVDNSQTTALKQQGQQTEATLQPLNDRDFEVAFIDAMVKGHQDALNAIDQNMNTVSNKELKKHLKATRTSVQHHLDQAKKIQQSLQNSNSNANGNSNS
ncbi:DUF4142 domain-containing protein [Legionella jordanis]|uniref:DUF4142 domain-containing protein n=1 Tax=Legionella jordanis TaxID=456 RepID=A0A0W0VBI7_9GAMM|nr:DUF4142 domain-containing protein [Legionella jordanis]KTD17492.1 hypothetical protein Ljor_1798 [Legionella jordanis]RMX05168.1 DUF4142 domain-containing protein [Legionella jordanis]RMX17424.1 DUF4142 domain-containing protein [Legionella jordanis]VEH13461.1 Predicted outer membrane protein [Legionella jordanis]HAT8714380.1 DUF4142 domain-containing protein [Legionella jordanis]